MAAPARTGARPLFDGAHHPGPASPDELETGHKYRKHRRRSTNFGGRELKLFVRSVACTTAGVVLGLLVLATVRKAHDLLLAPKVQQLVEQQRQQGLTDAEQQRRGMLLERFSGEASLGDSPAGNTGSTPVPGCISGAAAGSSAGVGVGGSGCAGQRLADADRQLLQREIGSILRSLSDEHPWVQGLPDAQPLAKVREGQQAGTAAGVLRKGQQLQVAGVQVQRVVDEPYGRQSSSNVPGVEDVHAELQAYGQAMVEAMVLEESAAAARQHRTPATELGLRALDDLNDTASIPARIAFLNELHQEVQAGETLRVCLTATTSADVRGVRRELLPWLQYHTALGAAHFYLLYDGQDGEAVHLLGQVRHITLMHIHPQFATAAERAKYELWEHGVNATANKQWAGQPGNFELMVKQGYGEGEALRLAAQDGMHWLLHLDPDELFHPGGPAFSLTAVLARQPPHVPAVRLMNFEGQPEAGDVANRIEQVTLFRVHKHFITPEALFYRSLYKLGDSTAFLTLYANGKSAVRVDAPGVRPLGPHFFIGNPSPRWQTAANPRGEWRDTVSDDSVVLHYAYTTLEEVAAKAHRSCPDDHLEAARRGDHAKLKECFVIDFDADAYMAAALGPATAKDFFFSRMVLSEGARVRCTDPALVQQGWCTLTDIERFKFLMEKVGLYRRLHAPATLLRQQERDIQRRLRQQRSFRGP